jgi:hypothetical protein
MLSIWRLRTRHMTEPQQALTIRDVDIGGRRVPPDQVVWVHRRGSGYVDVEYRGARGKVLEGALVPYPVPRPPLEELQQIEPCFGLADEHFEVECRSQEHYYEILRCRAHGRRFLRDARGTHAWYSTTTLLDEDEEGEPDDIWARYHWRSDSWLMHEKRTW